MIAQSCQRHVKTCRIISLWGWHFCLALFSCQQGPGNPSEQLRFRRRWPTNVSGPQVRSPWQYPDPSCMPYMPTLGSFHWTVCTRSDNSGLASPRPKSLLTWANWGQATRTWNLMLLLGRTWYTITADKLLGIPWNLWMAYRPPQHMALYITNYILYIYTLYAETPNSFQLATEVSQSGADLFRFHHLRIPAGSFWRRRNPPAKTSDRSGKVGG